MPRHARLQIIGPTTLFLALLGAESAAYALGLYPSSQMLWSINLRLFGIFQKSHYLLSNFVNVAYFQILFVGLPLFVTAWYGLIFKRQLAIAIASSLSFIYVWFILCAWYVHERSWHQTSSIVAGLAIDSGIWFSGLLLGASLLSVFLSHSYYLSACKA